MGKELHVGPPPFLSQAGGFRVLGSDPNLSSCFVLGSGAYHTGISGLGFRGLGLGLSIASLVAIIVQEQENPAPSGLFRMLSLILYSRLRHGRSGI